MMLIAGKACDDILSMNQNMRTRWYKTIKSVEKKEAMKIVETARRAKISMAMIGENNHMYGKTHSDKTRANMSVARAGENNYMYGKNHSEETKAKISASNTGEKHPMYGRNHTEESKSKISASMIGKKSSFFGKMHSEETKSKIGVANSGENNPNWQGGISFEPYGLEFNDELKNQIRKRDNYTCKECDKTEEYLGCSLDVHHIDYNKKNNVLNNLISLCRSCHIKTNFNREYWTEHYKVLIGV